MMQPSALLLATILFISFPLMINRFTSHTGISAFDGDNDVYASGQENSSYECKVAAINEKLGDGGGEKRGGRIKNCICC